MGLKEISGVLFSDGNHETTRSEVDKELSAGQGVTELCVRNNRAAPTDKRVSVYMWTKDGRHFSFQDRHLAAGETRGTDLLPLHTKVVAFEIQWRVLGSGLPMPATTGIVSSHPMEYFPAFGIRWDENDLYSLIYPV